MAKRYAVVDEKRCVACGVCSLECPKGVIKVWQGCYAKVEEDSCLGCGKCEKACPAGSISLVQREVAQ